MKKTTLSKLFFALMLVLMLALVACSDSTDGDGDASGADDPDTSDSDAEENDGNPEPDEDGLFSPEDFPMDTVNDGEAIDGGSITFGLVSDTVFEGTLNWNFYAAAPDAEVIKWFDESLLSEDETFTMTQDGAATFEISDDGKEFTFTIRDDVNWHDGEPVTAEDWAFSYEVIGHPDYDGPRYGDVKDVVGMEEYNAGETDTVEGLEVVDEKTLKVTYNRATPSLLTGGIWSYAMPKHIFEDIEVADMSSSPEVRENPIGMGPFKVESIVPGESVVYTKNEDYWQGEPNLDEVVLKVIDPTVVVNELETGGVDMVNDFPADQFPDNADMSNVQFLANTDLYYSYTGFKLGTWDKEESKIVPDPDAKMNNKNLRQAMAHAIDNDAIGERFYHGLRWGATTVIDPAHPPYHDEENPGLEYDPDKANELLDEAGYEMGEDGFRTDPDGEELVINYTAMSGSDVAEPKAEYLIQSWKEIGLNVQYLKSGLQEFNSFYDAVGNGGDDDPELDVFSAAWGTGSDVDPSGLYGDVMFNFTRWQNDDNDRLLEEGLSEEAFDVDKRVEIYKEWQALMAEEVPIIPELYALEIVPVNKRIQNYSIDRASDLEGNRHEIYVTEEEPVIDEN